MKTIKNIPALEQGDLILATVTGSKLKTFRGAPTTGFGWLCVTETSSHGDVISANFCPDGTKGYGSLTWPEFEAHVFIRGRHGETSPFAAITSVFESKCAAAALT
ncbi:MAG: hypothetical protein ACOYB3_01225 [Azonexus sp.]